MRTLTARTLAAIVTLLALMATPALAAPSRACLTQGEAAKAHPGQYLKYRQVGSVRCWFAGATPDKSEFKIAHAGKAPRAATSAVRQPQVVRAKDDDAMVGLAGTLCAGPCIDLRTIDPKELVARREAAHAAFVDYWLSYSGRYTLGFSDRWTTQ